MVCHVKHRLSRYASFSIINDNNGRYHLFLKEMYNVTVFAGKGALLFLLPNESLSTSVNAGEAVVGTSATEAQLQRLREALMQRGKLSSPTARV